MNKLLLWLPCLAVVLGVAAAVPSSAIHAAGPEQGSRDSLRDPGVSPALHALLQKTRGADTGQLAVSEEDGRFLRMLVASHGTRRALEIGAASGYSAIWIGLGLRDTGGRLVTIEYDPQRAKEAEANIRQAGLADIVQVISGDAFKAIPALPGTFDLVFLDAWKRDYQRFFELVFPRLDGGGLFLAHNVVNKASEMDDFLKTVRSDPALVSAIVSPSGEGISVSWKRKSR
jgi:predicted O-methyltransferase YrrM